MAGRAAGSFSLALNSCHVWVLPQDTLCAGTMPWEDLQPVDPNTLTLWPKGHGSEPGREPGQVLPG